MSGEFKGTPGRWIKRGDGIVAPGNIEVAVVVNFQEEEKMDADANLIAAAPQLLEALQECLPWVNNGLARGTHFKALSAINKALGKNV